MSDDADIQARMARMAKEREAALGGASTTESAASPPQSNEDAEMQERMDRMAKERGEQFGLEDSTPRENAAMLEARRVAAEKQEALAKAEANRPKTLGENAGALYEKGKGLLPKEMQGYVDDAALGVAGYLGGKALRSVIDPKYQYGTPEYTEHQARLGTAGDVNAVADQSRTVMGDAQQQHAAAAQAMQANADALAAQHAAAEQALRQAEQENLYHSSRNPTEEADERLRGVQRQVVGNAGEGAGGNTGRANQTGYNTRTAQEAARTQATASTLGSMGLNPTSALAQAPDLASTPSGLLVPKDVALEEEAKRLAAQREQDQRRVAFAQQVAREKAEAKLRLDQARAAEANARTAMAQEMQRLQRHAATPPISDIAQARHQENIARANSLQAEMPGTGKKMLEFVGKRILPRYVPGVGAAFAPLEAEQAKKDYDAGNYFRAAIHGAGSLGGIAQATGVPFLMGAGDILQTPATLQALYDFMQTPAAAKR